MCGSSCEYDGNLYYIEVMEFSRLITVPLDTLGAESAVVVGLRYC